MLPAERGRAEASAAQGGLPVEDLAGYSEGAPLASTCETLDGGVSRCASISGMPSTLLGRRRPRGGAGVMVLPCGAGKTIVGLGAMAKVGTHTLILTANVSALRQWRDEILDKTELTAEDIGEYTRSREGDSAGHALDLPAPDLPPGQGRGVSCTWIFAERDWGLIVYDEVHLLPAPVFRATASSRRVGGSA